MEDKKVRKGEVRYVLFTIITGILIIVGLFMLNICIMENEVKVEVLPTATLPTVSPSPISTFVITPTVLPTVTPTPTMTPTVTPILIVYRGIATWYGEDYHGRVMTNGEVYDMHDPTTCASNWWPLETWLEVRHEDRAIIVRVTDRGKFKHLLDLSYAAFCELDNPDLGVIEVEVEVLVRTRSMLPVLSETVQINETFSPSEA